MTQALVHALCGPWQGQDSWTVLDADFQDGARFLALWRQWRSDPSRPRLLHYVGVLAPQQATGLLPELAAHCPRLLAGFQRFALDQALVSLTLCVGERGTMLRELQMQADSIWAGNSTGTDPLDIWQLKAITRHARRGCRTMFPASSQPTAALLREAGLSPLVPSGEATAGAGDPLLLSDYAPPWKLHHSRAAARIWPQHKHALVLGAGLAGASVAHALARRSWQVTVIDQHAEPAQGASGLPVGLLVPHVSSDDSPRSRMARAGVRLMMQQAQQHLRQGEDWDPTGVLELHTELSAAYQPRGWEESGASRMHGATWADGVDGSNSLWHPWAAWIKPQALVHAWLKHPAIRFCGNTRVEHLCRAGGQWVTDAETGTLAPADAVVLCNATGAPALLQSLVRDTDSGVAWDADLIAKLQATQQLFGTLSFGPQGMLSAAALPPFPVNGAGSFIPHIKQQSAPHAAPVPYWYAGSTFETAALAHADSAAQQQANLAKLATLLPQVAAALPALGPDSKFWQGSRCVSHDRLPLVGPLDEDGSSGLWMSAAMGARGLSFAALCAELLVARMEGEPLPLEASLARSLDVNRPRRKKAAPA